VLDRAPDWDFTPIGLPASLVRDRLTRMSDEIVIATPRLELAAATPALLQAELRSAADLGSALGATVPAEWPPELYDRAAIEWTLRRLEAQPDAGAWSMYYIVRHAGDGAARTLIGVCGYKGPPMDGAVEIGYGILPTYQRQGFATEAVAALLALAFGDPAVRRVTAETYPHLAPSIGVLEKSGFTFAGPGSEEGVVRYELPREKYSAT
jgi:[ribosomal protein S5]-alanine N-acetyltransferase